MQQDIKITWPTFDHGSVTGIGGTAVKLSDSGFACKRGVTIKADAGNATNVFVGNSDVTAIGDDGTNGYVLDAGEEVTLAITNIKNVYVVADSPGQKVHWIAV